MIKFQALVIGRLIYELAFFRAHYRKVLQILETKKLLKRSTLDPTPLEVHRELARLCKRLGIPISTVRGVHIKEEEDHAS